MRLTIFKVLPTDCTCVTILSPITMFSSVGGRRGDEVRKRHTIQQNYVLTLREFSMTLKLTGN